LRSAEQSQAANQGAEEACSELEFAALQAMSALLSCGPCFTNQGLCYEGIFYPWLDMMLDSSDDKVSDSFYLFQADILLSVRGFFGHIICSF